VKEAQGGTPDREAPANWNVGRDFEMQVEVDTRWAKPMGSRTVPSPRTAFVRPLPQRMWKEAVGSSRRRGPGETSESRNLKRDVHDAGSAGCGIAGDVAGGSNPLKRPVGDREGTAWVAKRPKSLEVAVEARISRTEAARGEDTPRGAVLLRRRKSSEGENPTSAVSLRLRSETRSSEEQGVRGGRTPEAQTCRSWDPGAVRGRARAQGPRIGRFVRLGCVEGEKNPMRGGRGCSGEKRGRTLLRPTPPAAAGHVLKGRASRGELP